MPIPTYEQIRGKIPVWLLELDLGGDVRRYASQEITTSDGVTYRAGLEVGTVAIDEGLNRIGVVVQDPAEDWARYENRGAELDMNVGTLRLWWDGMTHEQAYGVLKGRTASATTGSLGQPGRLQLTLRGDDLDNLTPYPPAQSTVDRTTFVWDPANHGTVSNFDEAAEGFVYPVPIGYPGTGDTDDNNPPAVIEVPLVGSTTVPDSSGYFVMVALGAIDAAQVEVTDLGSQQGGITAIPRQSTLTVSTTTDQLGVTYSRIELDTGGGGTTGVQPTATVGPLAVAYRANSSWGGGILNRERTGPLRGLGEVISYCLEKSGIQADLGRQEAERGRLDGYKLDGLLCGGSKGRVDLEKLIQDDLGKLFPIRRMRSADGVWYRHAPWSPPATDTIAYLSADRSDLQRTSTLRKEHGKYNVFTLRFRTNHQRASVIRILGPEHQQLQPYTGVDERVSSSPICKASEALYGRREAAEVETSLVWNYSTAADILRGWADRDALPYRTVTYEGAHLEWLTPGDVIALTDTEIGLTDRIAVVDGVIVGGSVTTLSLILPFDRSVLTA